MESTIESVYSVDNIKRGFRESSAAKRYVGVQQRKSGRWQAVIKIKKTRFRLGTFDTPEEASMAVIAKKLELNEQRKAAAAAFNESQPSMLKTQIPKIVKRKVPTKCLLFGQTNAVYGNRDGTKYPEEIERVSGRISAIKRYKGVWRRKSGLWVCKIRDPLKNARVWVGIFETAEEACSAYYSKKLEFEAQVREATAAEKHEIPPIVAKESERESLNSATEIEDSGLESFNESVSTMNCNPLISPDEKLEVHDDEGGLIWGQFPHESIIDNHGFLLGEFSCVDDLRICQD